MGVLEGFGVEEDQNGGAGSVVGDHDGLPGRVRGGVLIDQSGGRCELLTAFQIPLVAT